MGDKPIIFSAPMVRALLDGRKTQTRRLLKRPSWGQSKGWPEGIMNEQNLDGTLSWFDAETGCLARLPIPQPGDRLYVREALRMGFDFGTPICHATYAADGADLDLTPTGALHWAETRKRNAIPSIHMPRWASRLTLTVTDVRVQRLQDISEDDARSEGIKPIKSGRGFYDPTIPDAAVRFGKWTSTARQGFCRLWNSIHGPDAWDANPWSVALTFIVLRGNINQIGGHS